MTPKPPNSPIRAQISLERISRYELLAELGRGSMGRVFLARDPHLDREVAVKVLLPAYSVGETPSGWDGDETGRRFLLEARAAGRLTHPGIVLVHDAGEDPETGLLFLVMERVQGPSLEALLRHSGRLTPSAAVEVTRQAARALEAAHRMQVVHRDVKPSNVLLTAQGVVKLTDFGIAKIGGEAMTATGLVLGSPSYMAPEQITGQAVDGRSDVFSLGAVLYRCLGGKLPFPGSSVAEITYKVAHTAPIPLAEICPDLPEALIACVERAMARAQEDRYGSPAELDSALEEVALGLGEPDLPKWIAPTMPDEPPRSPKHERSGATAEPGISSGAPSLSQPQRPPSTETRVADEAEDDAPTLLAETVFPPKTSPASAAPPVAVEATDDRRRTSLIIAGLLSLLAMVLAITTTTTRHFQEADEVDAASWSSVESARSESLRQRTESSSAGEASTSSTVRVEDESSDSASLAGDARAAASKERPSPPGTSRNSSETSLSATKPGLVERLPEAVQLTLVHQPKLGLARLTVLMDGIALWSEEVPGPETLFGRVAAQEIERHFRVAAGEHVFEARIEGVSRSMTATTTLSGRLIAGTSRTLRVTVQPRRETLKLDWRDEQPELIAPPPRPQ